MSDLIDRQALLSSIRQKQANGFPTNENLSEYALSCVVHAPSVDAVEVRHGEWIEEDGIQICSECGEEHEWEDFRATYCDNCGALMDGHRKEESIC